MAGRKKATKARIVTLLQYCLVEFWSDPRDGPSWKLNWMKAGAGTRVELLTEQAYARITSMAEVRDRSYIVQAVHKPIDPKQKEVLDRLTRAMDGEDVYGPLYKEAD